VCHMQHNKPRSAQRETSVRMHRARYTPDYNDVTAETCERERETERETERERDVVLLCSLYGARVCWFCIYTYSKD